MLGWTNTVQPNFLTGFENFQSVADVCSASTQINCHVPIARARNLNFSRKILKKSAKVAKTLASFIRIEI